MSCHIKTCLVSIPVMMISLMQAPMLFAASMNSVKASLAQHIPPFIQVGITQLGVSDEDSYVFCDEQDCPHRTIKYIAVAGIAKPPPLIMPEPVQETLPELAEPVPLKPTTKTKKYRVQKTYFKNTVRCATEK